MNKSLTQAHKKQSTELSSDANLAFLFWEKLKKNITRIKMEETMLITKRSGKLLNLYYLAKLNSLKKLH